MAPSEPRRRRTAACPRVMLNEVESLGRPRALQSEDKPWNIMSELTCKLEQKRLHCQQRQAELGSERRRLKAIPMQSWPPFVRKAGVSIKQIGAAAQWRHAGLTKGGFRDGSAGDPSREGGAFGDDGQDGSCETPRGIAQLLRMGWFRPVHCKSPGVQEVRACWWHARSNCRQATGHRVKHQRHFARFRAEDGRCDAHGFRGAHEELCAGQAMLEQHQPKRCSRPAPGGGEYFEATARQC